MRRVINICLNSNKRFLLCDSLCRWFKQLCNHRGVVGKAYYFYKPVGKGKTFGVKPEQALAGLKDGLRDCRTAFIYHCWNHYFCPIGYEEVPRHCHDAYRYES